ncbi:MAG: hypothetical protein NTZ69_18285 [Bacteroidia bacterium]|nr:hypothetical protein [Bacteroidia bacterium]
MYNQIYEGLFINYLVFRTGLLLTRLLNCKPEVIKASPTVTLTAVSNIITILATSGGEVTSYGNDLSFTRTGS